MSQDFDWEELLLLIGDRQVVPVVGRELLTVEVDGESILLGQYLARRLAERLDLPPGDLSAWPTINEVAVASLCESSRRPSSQLRLIQKTLAELVAAADFPIPDPLLKLAEISDFDVFVSTTFDDLLCRALDQVRHGGEPRTVSLAYRTQGQEDDLPDHLGASRDDTYVYHIFGSLESRSDFAVTDEDGLELLHRLQGSRHQPRRLFDELRDRNLLFLGCGFADGLARILVRTLGNQRLYPPRKTYKMVDREAAEDPDLRRFLRLFEAEAAVDGDAPGFVDQLLERWRATARPVAPLPTERRERPRETEGASVFLSYKSEDRPRVRVLAEALQEAGIQVWFDRDELEGGDAWDFEIERGISRCTLFLPVVSRNCQVIEGEFRREWSRALARSERIPPEVPFIIAVLLDPFEELLREEGAAEPMLVPREFWSKQYISLPERDAPRDFVGTIRSKMREVQLLRAGRSA